MPVEPLQPQSTVEPAAEASARDPLDRLIDPRTDWRSRIDHLTGGLLPGPVTARRGRVLVGMVVVVALGLGAVVAVVRHGSGSTAAGRPVIDLPMASAPPATTRAATGTSASRPREIVVAAAGAVVAPGVYRLPDGARVAELIAAASGLDPMADVDRVNLAAAVRDGERVYVPRRDQPEVPAVVAGGEGAGSGSGSPGATPGAGGSPSTTVAIVDLNTAGVDQLDALPGVGPATAAAIIADREANGDFRTVDDLARVRGIGPAKLEQLRPLVTV